MKTISERVLEALKEKPMTTIEVARELGLKRRKTIYESYSWGKWTFGKAESEGLIEWKDGKWQLKKEVI